MPRDRRRPSALLLVLFAGLSLAACAPSGAKPADSSTPIVDASQEPTPILRPRLDPTATPEPTPAPTPTPPIQAADLDGLMVASELAHREPIVVSIDDNRVARPQSGFNGASMVYHAPADGFETRYLLVFQEGDSSAVGPVRSARIYLAQWASEIRAAFGHYGGDRLTRKWIAANTKKLLWSVDGLGAGNPAYHRTRDRKAPHNAYTSTADLRRVATKLGAPATFGANLHVRPFRDDSPVAQRGAKQTVSIPFRTVTVGYTYDPRSNSYRRLLDGKTHIDRADGKAVTARTVLVLYMKFHLDSRIEPGHARPVLGSIGTGKALVISEGKTVAATWSKTSADAPTRILDAEGNEIPFVRGRIFIEVVPTGTKVSA
jgi:hypothetical protein